ncbi:division/cell wall cluster transcriptional repressor MraZ [Sedimentibacter sp. zth1]|uniref:division/cell wall cluster transcriptional repressor MraZ n=1 Tax=Sedimentibacter sp. zth1 TaxID=2816908 RepID=UPI001A92EE7A|nr:division/cell wall cluster transcriptional repressor MraZ [Sedimentibacter sp. zth1]QSX06144.1 division/cell wall cluster transcriptional repressor MraZ [Sedimentibacter sp. zth1]
MFTGEYIHSFDMKGRVIIPSKYRDELGEVFYIGKGLDRCLYVYPIQTWEEFIGKLKNLSTFNKEERFFLRQFISGFTECSFDKQGRLLVPPNLREFSNLVDEVVIIGVIDKIEIWNKQSWEAYSNNEEFDFDGIAEKMSELGIGL